MSKNARVIAFYLPQYHPFPENNDWWGRGFTEWTNVGKAKPLFRGHYQPRVPADLGYYDLRLPIVREQQAELAKEAGIEGFCYWHYWFGNGKRLIADVFQDVLDSGKPNFPFCLAWANHSWYSKNWNSDGSVSQKLLIEQTYPGLEDAKQHFDFLIAAFKDNRYLKVNDKPFLLIFDPVTLPQIYIDHFRTWAIEAGFQNGIYLVANITHSKIKKEDLLNRGYDAVTYQRLNTINSYLNNMGRIGRGANRIYKGLKGFVLNRPPKIFDYKRKYNLLITEEDKERDVLPSIIPQWDHTPRSGWNGSLFINSTPDVFYKHVNDALDAVNEKPEEEKIILLKSWNEWGEGNYMEPDLRNGLGFINALKRAIEDYQ